jgi:hypothetical protein
MFRRYEATSLFAAIVNASRSAAVVLAAFGVGVGMSSQVSAGAVATLDRLPGDDQHNGNGKFNRISSPFNSPNFMRGIQHVINANSGGSTVNQSAFCKRKAHCKIVQNAHTGGW